VASPRKEVEKKQPPGPWFSAVPVQLGWTLFSVFGAKEHCIIFLRSSPLREKGQWGLCSLQPNIVD
jgi:hypothetical protein